MTQEERNKVIEDKAMERFIPHGNQPTFGGIDYEIMDTIRDKQLGFVEGMREALTNPTDIGLCRQCTQKDISGVQCDRVATKDYNSHSHWVCDVHFTILNDEFDEEYK